MTAPLRLEDIIPKPSSFTLTLPDGAKEFHLRPVSLSDEIWLSREFGAKLSAIFAEVQMPSIARIVFHQLEESDKAFLGAKTVKIVNEDGESVEEKIGGAKLLLCYLVGHAAKMEVYQALMETIGVSRPITDAIVDEEKKNLNQLLAGLPIGAKSSISSVPNMAGPQNTLAAEPSEKSLGASAQSPDALTGNSNSLPLSMGASSNLGENPQAFPTPI